MAARARLIGGYRHRRGMRADHGPDLDRHRGAWLDFVVKTDTTRQYTTLIAGSKHIVLKDTGHQGTLTRPDVFAEIVRRFAEKGTMPQLEIAGPSGARVLARRAGTVTIDRG